MTAFPPTHRLRHAALALATVAVGALSGTAALAEDVLRRFALDNGPAYAHPRAVWFVDELPLAGTNKVDREQLRRLVAEAAVTK